MNTKAVIATGLLTEHGVARNVRDHVEDLERNHRQQITGCEHGEEHHRREQRDEQVEVLLVRQPSEHVERMNQHAPRDRARRITELSKGSEVREGAVPEVRLDPHHRREGVGQGEHHDDRALASLAFDGEQHAHTGNHQAEVGSTTHDQQREDGEPSPSVGLGEVERAQQAGHGHHLGVEAVEVQVVHHRIDRIDEHQGRDGPHAEIRQPASYPPQRHHGQSQRGRLQHEQSGDDRQHVGHSGHRIESERGLLCQEVARRVAERDVGREPVVDQPRRLRVDRQVLGSVERPSTRK